MGREDLGAEPAEAGLAVGARHLVAAAGLLDRDLAARTLLHVHVAQDRRLRPQHARLRPQLPQQLLALARAFRLQLRDLPLHPVLDVAPRLGAADPGVVGLPALSAESERAAPARVERVGLALRQACHGLHDLIARVDVRTRVSGAALLSGGDARAERSSTRVWESAGIAARTVLDAGQRLEFLGGVELVPALELLVVEERTEGGVAEARAAVWERAAQSVQRAFLDVHGRHLGQTVDAERVGAGQTVEVGPELLIEAQLA
eukprot:3576757-Rhodomonas_salina.2